MNRIAASSAAIVALAVAASLTTSFWLNRMDGRGQAMAATAPTASAPQTATGAAAQVTRAADGHYWAEAMIDGKAVRVLVDTGASVVALTRADAARLGLRLSPEDFTRTVETASGPVRAAGVELASVAVAGVRVEKVAALVVEEGLAHSLLGMSYLGRLSRIEATPHGITLRP
jgi:aspartyl protease family protein